MIRPRLGQPSGQPRIPVLNVPRQRVTYGGFGSAVTLAPNVGQINNLQIAPGHAVLTFNSVVTSEPVS